jgi:hypothetical protein
MVSAGRGLLWRLRVWLRGVVVVLGISTLGMVAASVVLPISKASAVTCTDSWTNTSGGNFGTGTNWSTGSVPSSSDDACITATGTYTVTDSATYSVNSLTLGGSNGTQTLVLGSGDTLGLLTDSTINTNGVLTLGDAGNGNSTLAGGNTVTLTNHGNLDTVLGGGGLRLVHLNVDNASDGTADVATNATALVDSPGTTITNDGALTVDSGGTLSLISGGNSFHNDGGTVTNNGSVLDRNGTFYQRGGTETGNAVALAPATLDDDTTARAASFTFTAGFLTGTGSSPGIAAGQTVTVSASPGSVNLAVSPFLNDGTVVLGDAVSGNSTLGGGNSVTLTNHGNLDAVLGGGGLRLVQLNVDNASDGTVDVATNASALMDTPGTTITNDGSFMVDSGGTFSLSNGINFVNGGGNVTLASTAQFQLNGDAGFTQDGDGTFTDTIDATTGDFGQLTGCGPGCGVAVDGKLDITTVGTPAVGSTWPIINTSGRSGNFSTYAFGTINYAATYPSAGVTLVVDTYTPSVSITPSAASPITVGTSVHVTAALIGATSNAGGTITYGLYSNSSCTALLQDLTPSPNTVTSGAVPNSNPYTFNTPGTFYFQATYSGDADNAGPVSSACTSTLVVNAPPTSTSTAVTATFTG